MPGTRMNRDRHVFGETNPIYMLADQTSMIYTGDLLALEGVYAAPSDYITINSVNTGFIGVAMQYAINGDPVLIRVATTGVFEFDTSDEFLAGETVYQAEAEPQFVYGTGSLSAVAQSFGRAWKRYSSSTSKVLVKIDTGTVFPHGS